jgi:hypothetical protein
MRITRKAVTIPALMSATAHPVRSRRNRVAKIPYGFNPTTKRPAKTATAANI